MSFISQNLNLPYIAPAQAQKHVTHNEALRALDAVIHLSLVSKSQTTPPLSPVEGSRYFVAITGTDEWAGQDALIAAYQDGAWAFYTPQIGWQAWIEDESVLQIWDGTVWQSPMPTPNHQNMEFVGVNTTADTTNRLSVSSPATLLNHAGNGHQLKLNKNTAGDTGSVLYQTNWSGRAEIGLTGDDNFRIKVSPDGSTWHNALFVDAGINYVGIGTATPMTKLDVDGPIRPKSYSVAALPSAANNGAGAIIYVSDETGGAVLAFSDGVNWRRVTDQAVVA